MKSIVKILLTLNYWFKKFQTWLELCFVSTTRCPQGGKYRNSTCVAVMYQFYTIGIFFGNLTDRDKNMFQPKFQKNQNSVGNLIGWCNKVLKDKIRKWKREIKTSLSNNTVEISFKERNVSKKCCILRNWLQLLLCCWYQLLDSVQ